MMACWAQAETPERVSREPNPSLENKKAAFCHIDKKLQTLFHNMFSFSKRNHNFEFFMDKNPFLWYNKK